MDYKSEIINYCNSLGLDAVGVTECRRFDELEKYFTVRKLKGYENEFEEQDIEKRINPNIYMEEGKAIISIAFPYVYNLDYGKDIYFSKYTLGNDYHTVVSAYLQKICGFIESLGGMAKYFVDSNTLPERYIASLAGVGFRGKNNMIITEKYGSYVFLGEIITNLDLQKDNGIECKCGDCNLCLKACPTSSIRKDSCNSNVCLSYITQKKDIDDVWINKLKGRIFGCDACQDVCPYNKKISFSNIKEFTPYNFMENINVNELIRLDNKTFKEKYKLTSCGWRGKNILTRNALINAMSLGMILDIDEKDFSSPYIRQYYSRLLSIYKL